MPTYVYETLPASPTDTAERFEVRQRFSEPALSHHPITGQPVQRLISGGLGVMVGGKGSAGPEPSGGCGPDTCQCGRFS